MEFRFIKDNYFGVKDLLRCAVGYPTEEKLNEILNNYKTQNHILLGVYDKNKLMGCIGFYVKNDILILKHIAVDSEKRGQGLGKALITEVMEQFHPSYIIAETDRDAVEFYRKCEFNVCSFQGARGLRYKCVRVIGKP